MKTKPSAIGVMIIFMLIIPFATTAFAVEGGLGRPISGASINPYAGLVPPAPGFAASIGEEYYSGTISGATTVPIANFMTLGIEMKASFTPIAILYISNTPGKEWSFASA